MSSTTAVVFASVLLLLLTVYPALVRGQYAPVYGILKSKSTSDLNGTQTLKHCILFYDEISHLPENQETAEYLPVSDGLDWDVCGEEPPPPSVVLDNHYVFIAADNSCSVLTQADYIQRLGAAGTLVVQANLTATAQNNTNNNNMTLAFINNSSYHSIMATGEDVVVGLYSPKVSPLPLSLLVVWLLAMFAVVVGSYWSGVVRHKLHLSEEQEREALGVDGMREPPEPGMPREETSLNISVKNILCYVVLMCTMLLSLYFLFDYLVYMILGIFCFAAMIAVFCCLDPIVALIPCGRCRTPYFNIYIIRGTLEVRQVLLALFAIGVTLVWLVMRKEPWAWILQDALGIAFSINILRVLRLPNLKICTILLCGLVIYDIFFVFITPFITADGKSIMVEVAKGGSSQEEMPMVLKVPVFDYMELANVCNKSNNYNLLGFGDILIPGLLVAFCHAFDLITATPCRLYFLINIIGYGSGLLVTFLALWLLGIAQPALLYLVPCTLIPTLITAAARKELRLMWSGTTEKFKNEQEEEEEDLEEPEEDPPISDRQTG